MAADNRRFVLPSGSAHTGLPLASSPHPEMAMAAPPPMAKRNKPAAYDDGNDDDSTLDSKSEGGSSGNARGPGGKPDSSARMSLRKEKKSAREKARRQRENALFDELANMCNVPADTRDKSSVLKAVIKRVEELKVRGGNTSALAALAMNLGNMSSASSVSSVGSLPDSKSMVPPPPPPTMIGATLTPQHNQGSPFDDLIYATSRPTWSQTSAPQYTMFSPQTGYGASQAPTAQSFPQTYAMGGQPNNANPAAHFNFTAMMSPSSSSNGHLPSLSSTSNGHLPSLSSTSNGHLPSLQGHPNVALQNASPFPPPPPNKGGITMMSAPPMSMMGNLGFQTTKLNGSQGMDTSNMTLLPRLPTSSMVSQQGDSLPSYESSSSFNLA